MKFGNLVEICLWPHFGSERVKTSIKVNIKSISNESIILKSFCFSKFDGYVSFCYYMLKKRIKEIPKYDTKEFVSVSLSVFQMQCVHIIVCFDSNNNALLIKIILSSFKFLVSIGRTPPKSSKSYYSYDNWWLCLLSWGTKTVEQLVC